MQSQQSESPLERQPLSDDELLALHSAAREYPLSDEHWSQDQEHDVKYVRRVGVSRWPLRNNLKLVWRVWHHKGSPLFAEKKLGRKLSATWAFLTRLSDDRPDATLDHGNVICFWSETGDYLEAVSPTVVRALAEELVRLRGLTPHPLRERYHSILADPQTVGEEKNNQPSEAETTR